ncbi:alpha-N-arabinofuranosidase [Parvularcula dongshanensis]|uniref:non-reducing end alpha-L-arabinofuranosidase n=1 Tax=Parvularcula dongshanensis TaxID=1173995 RepID=A0A840I6R6_9PROT|nr:alpha-L-arabinofuranosidase C-terminal domain-containing protein [Parvularcula dongshanensis]MBB4659690.1 alpha-N-arabinofuranosidase [Parvularcula dongshanensis]
MKLAAQLRALAVSVTAISAAHAQTELTIDQSAPIGTIQPEVYGQFVEHLGAGIYDGIWVGEDSDIPNTDGIRDDVFAALDRLEIPVMRWPGGCYADLYHWRDGIGPRNERAGTVNMAWGGTPESNQFGTHEFFNLAERLGAKTYLNVNLGTGTPGEAQAWLEYITLPEGSDLANERKANGREKPWKIDYLSIGNETWGCGGNMRPAFYADLYAQWATLLQTAGEAPKRILSGSHEGNIDYSDEVLDHPGMGNLADGISLHYYTLPNGDWADKGEATDFSKAQWAETITRTLRMEDAIERSLAMIDSHNFEDDFDLYVDEWGMWVNTEEGAPALYQQNTIRDAVVAALNFNLFHQHADRVPMTNIAQMVNVLQAMILTDGGKMVLTPTYHVFDMYRPFQGATALPVSFEAPTYGSGDDAFPALSASAARTEDGTLVLAFVNADPEAAHGVTLQAGDARRAEGRVLSAEEIDAHNTFASPNEVQPEEMSVRAKNGTFELGLPARSVTVLKLVQ